MASSIRVSPIWIHISRVSIHLISLTILGLHYYWAQVGRLEGDPVQRLLDLSGIGTLNLLLLTLVVAPLSRRFRFLQIMRLRKTFGVYAAVYALFHVYIFIRYELMFEWALILSEIIERPYITVGFIALSILCLLLATSTKAAQKRLRQNWQKLHNFIYLAAILGGLHFLWSVKSDITEPVIYIIIILILLVIPSYRRQRLKVLPFSEVRAKNKSR